jgi:hypothetical protein
VRAGIEGESASRLREVFMADKPTFEEVLSELSMDQRVALILRNQSCIIAALDYIWNNLRELREHFNLNVVDSKLQMPPVPQPNTIIYHAPGESGHPPFHADDPNYEAEGWNQWPKVPPRPSDPYTGDQTPEG